MRLLLVVIAAIAWPAAAVAAEPQPSLPLAAYVIADGSDGLVLAARSADAQRPIASLTKMMTAYVAIRAGALDRSFTVPAAATAIGESTVSLRAGQRISGRALFDALLVPSANDAAETLAIGVAGSERAFVATMNATARRLGMGRTVYRAPYGLDAPGQYSTAADQLVLARLLMRDRRIRAIVRQRSVTVNGTRYAASNTLLGTYRGLDGVKTGHTSGAGWCLAATARRHGQRVFAVALGAPDEASRNASVTTLLSWGLRRLHPTAIVRAGEPAGAVPTSGAGAVPVVAARAVIVTIRPGDRIRIRYELPGIAALPVAQGASLGRLVVLRNGVAAGAVPVVSPRGVPAPGLLDRVSSTFGRLLDPSAWW